MQSSIEARFTLAGARTALHQLRETGALRLRVRPRAPCIASIVNTGGGVVGGDDLHQQFEAAAHTATTITTAAAEKIYRADGAATRIATRLRVDEDATMCWLPQETILFDGVDLDRRIDIDLARNSTFLGADTIVFGRLAHAERSIAGQFRDSLRLRRDGELLFADVVRLDGPIGLHLDRPAVAGGARAAALIVRIGADNDTRVAPLREALAPFAVQDDASTVDSGVSAIGPVLVARLLAVSPARLRTAMVAALPVLDAPPPDRLWV